MECNKKQKKYVIGAILLGVGAVAITTVVMAASGGMGGPSGGGRMNNDMGAMNEKTASIITVKLAAPTIGSLERDTEFIGKIEAADTVSIFPETNGKVSQLYFDEGDYIKSGDLLMELDTTDLDFELQKAAASYESTVASANKTLGSDYTSKIISAETSVEKAQESYRKARLNYKSEIDSEDDNIDSLMSKMDDAEAQMDSLLDEYNHMKSDTSISNEELQVAYEDYLAARTDYNSYADLYSDALDGYDDLKSSVATEKNNTYKDLLQAQNQMELTTGNAYAEQKAVIEAQFSTAQLSLETAQRNLDKTRLYAPVSGKVVTRTAEEFGSVSTNTAVFTVQSDESVQLAFNASADGAEALGVGDGLTVTRGGKEYKATVTEVKTEADSASGLFPIKAQLEDDTGLLPGVTVKVRAATARAENALMVAIDNVYYDVDVPYVFVYEDGKAVRKDLVTGMSDASTIVVEDGILPSSLVITTWHPDMKNGVAVVLAEGQETVMSEAKNAPGMPEQSVMEKKVKTTTNDKVGSLDTEDELDDDETVIEVAGSFADDGFGVEIVETPQYPDEPRTTDLSPAYVGDESVASSMIAKKVIAESTDTPVLKRRS